MNFADLLHKRIKQTNSVIVAGIDPRLDLIPEHFHKIATKYARTNSQFIFKLLTEFHGFAIAVLSDKLAAIKPNLAFFEAFGIAGLQAYSYICKDARNSGIPVIADAKRGDIGSTAEAYSKAFLAGEKYKGLVFDDFVADALTVNPFLGFDTLEPFINACKNSDKGLFVLVKTSNPGSSDLQAQRNSEQHSISEQIAMWLNQNAAELMGSCGYSSLGAVVGATYPEDAKQLRQLMPKNIFLIPGVGSQGGDMQSAKAGFGSDGLGAVVNVSRALLGNFPNLHAEPEQLREQLLSNADKFSLPI